MKTLLNSREQRIERKWTILEGRFKHGDDRLIKQSKLFAVITLFLALEVPVFYQLFLFTQMIHK